VSAVEAELGPRVIPVLCYHSVGPRRVEELQPWELEPAYFDDQISYLRDVGYEPVPLRALAAWLRNPASVTIPTHPVVVTFDDGYTNFELAADILAAHRVPVTLFVPTAYIDDGSTWFDSPEARRARILSWNALRDLHRGGVEIGSHSHRHIPLDEQPFRRAKADIVLSKQLLEDELGEAVRAFAYPYGYYDGRVRRELARAGFEYACAVKNWTSGRDDDHLAIARVFPPAAGDLSTFDRVLRLGNRRPRRREPVQTKAWRMVRRARAQLWRRNATRSALT
jgi:peptidoglycan/xylan/chitin deacetylase (PgdA/CDA1 family)